MRGGTFESVEGGGVGVKGEDSGEDTEGEDIGDENRDIVEDDRKKGCRSIKEKREQVLSFRLQMIT